MDWWRISSKICTLSHVIEYPVAGNKHEKRSCVFMKFACDGGEVDDIAQRNACKIQFTGKYTPLPVIFVSLMHTKEQLVNYKLLYYCKYL